MRDDWNLVCVCVILRVELESDLCVCMVLEMILCVLVLRDDWTLVCGGPEG